MTSVQAPSMADLVAKAAAMVDSEAQAPAAPAAAQVAAPVAAPVMSAEQSARIAAFKQQKQAERSAVMQNGAKALDLGGVATQHQAQQNKLGTDDYQKLAEAAKYRAAQTESLRGQVVFGLQEIANIVPPEVAKAANLKQGVDLKRDKEIDEKKGVGGFMARSARGFTRMIGLDKKQDAANFTIKGAIQKSGQVSAMMNAELGAKIQNIITERQNTERDASWARSALKDTEIRINDLGAVLIESDTLVRDIEAQLAYLKANGAEQSDDYAQAKEYLGLAKADFQAYAKDAQIAQDDANALNGFLDVVQGIDGSGGLIQSLHDAEALNTRVQRAIAIENKLQQTVGGAAIAMQEATATADIARTVVATSRAITEAVLTTTLDQQEGAVKHTDDLLAYQQASNGRIADTVSRVNGSMADRRNSAAAEAMRRAGGGAPSTGTAPAAPTKSPLEAFVASRRT